MTRPILVFGAGGRVAETLADLIMATGNGYHWYFMAQRDVDITDAGQVQTAIARIKPAALVNLAACTLPRAEHRRDEAEDTNVHAVANMAGWRDVPCIHISTDCVFDGEKVEPYTETDDASPSNWYGETKWRGEQALRNTPMGNAHIIIRTTGVYLADKPNFLKLVLDKARAGESMDVIADTLYSPTDARELARAILTATERVIEDPSVSGTYHFAGPDHMSYLDFAKLALEEAGLTMEIRPVTLAEREIVDGFKRPRNASLNSDKFAEVFGLRHRPTRECLRELVQPRQ